MEEDNDFFRFTSDHPDDVKEEKKFLKVIRAEKRAERKMINEFKLKLKGLINVQGLFKYLKEHTYYIPEDIVDIVLTDEKSFGYSTYQHARIVNDKENKLYKKTEVDEIRNVDHYYVWQTAGYLGDDFSGYLLFPLKNGKYFKVFYCC